MPGKPVSDGAFPASPGYYCLPAQNDIFIVFLYAILNDI